MKARACYLVVIALGVNLGLAAAEPTSAAKKDASKKDAPKSAEAAKGGDITDPKLALADIPRDAMKDLRPGSRGAEAAAVKATAQVRKNVEGKTGKFEIMVTRMEKLQRKDTPDVNRTRLLSTNGTLREGGTTFKVIITGTLVDSDEKEKLPRIKEGSKVTITGTINNGQITMPRNELELHIDMMDAKLVN
jgi:hypothetical protein